MTPPRGPLPGLPGGMSFEPQPIQQATIGGQMVCMNSRLQVQPAPNGAKVLLIQPAGTELTIVVPIDEASGVTIGNALARKSVFVPDGPLPPG